MKYVLISVILSLFPFSGALADEADKLAWLAGHWVHKDIGEEVQENWLGPKGGMLVAVNLTSNAGKTSFEFIRIAKKGTQLVYFASPQGRPVTEFPMKQMDEQSITFENTSHDFPQRIIYRREGEKLIARIEGMVKGNLRSKEWKFDKKN